MSDHDDGRRRLLGCMAWVGTGLLWTVSGGVPRSLGLPGPAQAATAAPDFVFAQISDSHIGFARDPNTDTPATLKAALDQVAAQRPAMMLHTGDVSHLSKPAQFDTAAQLIGATGIETHYVPGEHDWLDDEGRPFVVRFQSRTKQGAPDGGFYSFDAAGIHFVGLNNVADLRPGGLGALGARQLAWLKADLAGRSASTPVVVFAHIPLWLVYRDWGWGTEDAAQALALLKRFGSVTVLNGHIHQILQKVEGTVAFHTARSTAFPQPAPGSAPSPGPMKVEPGRLRELLGVASVTFTRGQSRLAVVDTPIGA
jgi:3',5'-cyclic AMP phosphodiesterase CpdA